MAVFIIGSMENINIFLDTIDSVITTAHNDFCAPSINRHMIDHDIFKTEPLDDCKPLLTIAFEVPNSELNASTVLLEFFKKNSEVLFSAFTYEINRLDSENSQIIILFEKRSSIVGPDIGDSMKKSIAEYMNQINKELFVTCIKAGLTKSRLRHCFEQETHPDQYSKLLNYFLYQDKFEDSIDLMTQSFEFWYSIAKRWARAPWAIYFIDRKPNKKSKIKDGKTQASKKCSNKTIKKGEPVQRADVAKPSNYSEIYILPNLDGIVQNLSYVNVPVQLGRSEHFTHINLSYDLKSIKKVKKFY